MVERVTENLLTEQALHSINTARKKQVKNQEAAINMKRINKPSDDPVGTTQVLRIRNLERNVQQFRDNAATAVNLLNTADKVLESTGDVINRAYELAVGQSSAASATPETRAAIAREVEQLKAQLITIANTRFGDRYIFGGFQTTMAPFTSRGDYRGDLGNIPLEVKDDYYVATNIPGNIIFNGYGRKHLPPPPPRPVGGTDKQTSGAKEGDRKPASDVQRREGQLDAADQGAAKAERAFKAGEVGTDIFKLFDRFRIALETNDVNSIQHTLDEWGFAQDQIFMARATVGARVNSIERTMNELDMEVVDTARLRSELEDLDAVKAVTDLQKDEEVLTRTLASGKKLLSTNLFDFMK